MSSRPLEGIRIIECATWHAAPGGNAILADLGAEVIKIETLHGDPLRSARSLGTLEFDIEGDSDWSLLLEMANRNKRGICLDLKSEKGMQIVHQLVKDADVFVTNLKAKTKKNMGIDYETLSRLNPRIIHANMTGFGPKGPLADVGGFDPMGQAVSGMMRLAGKEEPFCLQAIILDQMSSVLLSHSIMAALLARERQGIGQEVTVSLYSAAIMLTHVNVAVSSMMGEKYLPRWSRLNQPPLRTSYKCADDKWIQCTNHPEDKYWPIFRKIMGLERLAHDPRFADMKSRIKNANVLIPIIDDVMRQKTRDEWMKLFIDAGLMFVPIQTMEEVVKDPQLWANGYMMDFEHPYLGTIQIPGYPANFSVSDAGTHRAAPGLGEHTDEILKEIGLSESEIQQLKNENVIKQKKER